MKYVIAMLLAMVPIATPAQVGIPFKPCMSADEPARFVKCSGDRTWHVLAVAESGTVTLLKDLTKHEADFAAARLQGLPATPAEVKQDADAEAAAALAAKVVRDREDERLRKLSPLCPTDKPYDGSAVWEAFRKTLKDIPDPSGSSGDYACHHRDGTIENLGGWTGSFNHGLYEGRISAPERPWSRHNDMKMVEVFQ